MRKISWLRNLLYPEQSKRKADLTHKIQVGKLLYLEMKEYQTSSSKRLDEAKKDWFRRSANFSFEDGYRANYVAKPVITKQNSSNTTMNTNNSNHSGNVVKIFSRSRKDGEPLSKVILPSKLHLNLSLINTRLLNNESRNSKLTKLKEEEVVNSKDTLQEDFFITEVKKQVQIQPATSLSSNNVFHNKEQLYKKVSATTSIINSKIASFPKAIQRLRCD